jgi:hypothetical protein
MQGKSRPKVFSRLASMRLRSPRLPALALTALLAVGLSACGSSGGANLLPGTTASQINSNLDEVRQLVAEGECVGARDAADQVTAQVDELGGIDAKLKQLLVEGAQRLEEVVAGCEEAEVTSTGPSEEEEEPGLEEDEKAPKHEKTEKTKPKKETGPPAEPPEPPGHEEEGKGEGESSPEGGSGGTPSGGVGPGQELEG